MTNPRSGGSLSWRRVRRPRKITLAIAPPPRRTWCHSGPEACPARRRSAHRPVAEFGGQPSESLAEGLALRQDAPLVEHRAGATTEDDLAQPAVGRARVRSRSHGRPARRRGQVTAPRIGRTAGHFDGVGMPTSSASAHPERRPSVGSCPSRRLRASEDHRCACRPVLERDDRVLVGLGARELARAEGGGAKPPQRHVQR